MKKVLKSKIVQTIFSLLTLGAIAKILSTIAKVITVRLVSLETMGVYSLAASSIVLIVTIVQAGLPPTIARMIGGKEEKNVKIITTATIIVSIVSLLLMAFIALAASFFANNILKNKDTLPAIYALIPLVPLIGFGSLIKAYYIGINKVQYTGWAQVTEEIARILFLIFFAGIFSQISPAAGAAGIMIGLSVGEVASVTHLLLYSRKRLKIQVHDMKQALQSPLLYKQMLPTAVSLTSGRLISSLTYFAEPIILSNIMLSRGFTAEHISIEYGLLSTLAMPLLLLPGFFTSAIANAMLPIVARDFKTGNKKHAINIIVSLTAASAVVGVLFALLCFFFPGFLMQLLYGSSDGKNYVAFIAFPFILYYIQTPISAALIALGKEKAALRDTIIGSIIRIVLMVVLIPSMQLYGVALATIINVLIVTVMHIITVVFTLWK